MPKQKSIRNKSRSNSRSRSYHSRDSGKQNYGRNRSNFSNDIKGNKYFNSKYQADNSRSKSYYGQRSNELIKDYSVLSEIEDYNQEKNSKNVGNKNNEKNKNTNDGNNNIVNENNSQKENSNGKRSPNNSNSDSNNKEDSNNYPIRDNKNYSMEKSNDRKYEKNENSKYGYRDNNYYRQNSRDNYERRDYNRNNFRKNIGYFKDGDWICLECKNINFSWRTKCNKCNRDVKDCGDVIKGKIKFLI